MTNFDFMFDPPVGHAPECNCEPCHRGHVEAGIVPENAARSDFRCCADQLEIWIEEGKWCGAEPKKHGGTYMDVKVIDGARVFSGRCLECVPPQ